jgi:hypothetical protein
VSTAIIAPGQATGTGSATVPNRAGPGIDDGTIPGSPARCALR